MVEPADSSGESFEITDVTRTYLEIPYRDVPEQSMLKEFFSWNHFELIEVSLDSGDVGYGEQMSFYSPRQSTEEDLASAIGEDASRLMWDDHRGVGLQMAVFDAVGKAVDEPIYRLLGAESSKQVPMAWWCNDMDEDSLQSECEAAVDAGYRHVKYKARPWHDIRSIIDGIDSKFGDTLTLCPDFNGMLLRADLATEVLDDLNEFEIIRELEEPLFQDDLAGYHRISDYQPDISIHYDDTTKTKRADMEDVSTLDPAIDRYIHGRSLVLTPERDAPIDGFVLTGGVSQILEGGKVANFRGKSGKIQVVGSGIATTFGLHLASAVDCPLWPSIDCHPIYQPTLIEEPIEVTDGVASVTAAPGLGVDVDMDAIREYETSAPDHAPEPPRLIKVTWPDANTMYFSGEDAQLQAAARTGAIPYYREGVATEVLADDGSDEWAQLHRDARNEPVEMSGGQDDPL